MIRSLFLALLLALLAAGAFAHARSASSTPEDGATVAEVEALEVRFEAPVRVISVTLESDGDEVSITRETGTEAVTEFRAVPDAALESGAYRLDWRGMAADGHPMQGGFAFTVAE